MVKVFEQFSDHDIIQKVINKDNAMFTILIRRYNADLYKIGRSYRFDHQDTEDLLQDTFIDAYLNLAKFAHRSSFKTWIIRIMLNKCYKKSHNIRSTSQSGMRIMDDALPMFFNPAVSETEKVVINQELRIIIESALLVIPQPYRITFTLKELNGLTIAEIADLLGISPGNVKVRLHRAKSMLQREIEKAYSPDDIFEFNDIHCNQMVNRIMSAISTTEAGTAHINI